MPLEQTDRALLTDLYELTMSAAYFTHDMNRPAAFEMFIRSTPERPYLIAAGLEQVVSYLQNLEFDDSQIDYLRGLDVFSHFKDGFWDYLRDFSFNGSVQAIPEGTVVFGTEPLLRVQAPLIEAQLIETFLLSMINFQTLVATKAARVTEAACCDGKQRGVVDFGSRRAHGPDAAVLAARASYIGRCMGSSNVEAGYRTGIPVFGTQAHSFVMAFDTEEEAFRAYYDAFPETCVLLIDTYDVHQGTEKAAEVAPELNGVRIDSGDIAELSHEVRAILDDHGLEDARVLASGDLDEFKIQELIERGADCDAFGVGTALVTSKDLPALSGVYKLTAVRENGRWKPKIKLSEEKATYPGMKQVYRERDGEGRFRRDILCTDDEDPPDGTEPLLEPLMQDGELVRDLPELEDIRDRTAEQLRDLPEQYKKLREPDSYPLHISEKLEERRDTIARKMMEESK